MIEALIGWSLRNRALVLLAAGFLVAAGVWAMRETPLDAVPDLSDVQVIVQTDFAEQAPQIVEDQVTYPITSEMLKVPGWTPAQTGPLRREQKQGLYQRYHGDAPDTVRGRQIHRRHSQPARAPEPPVL